MNNYNERIPDFSNLNTNFGYNLDNLNTAYKYFKNMNLNNYLIASLLANGIAESGFNPKARNPKTSAKGIFLWLDGRYKYSSDKLDENLLLMELLDYIKDTLNNTTDRMSWHHGGAGSGYNRAIDAYNAFANADNLEDAVHSFTYGYNRPDNVVLREKQRLALAKEIYNRLDNSNNPNNTEFSPVPLFLRNLYSIRPSLKKGGKAFVNGVSILDSNPKAYKLVKKKYKIKEKLIEKGLEGLKTKIREDTVTPESINIRSLTGAVYNLPEIIITPLNNPWTAPLSAKDIKDKEILTRNINEAQNTAGKNGVMFLSTASAFPGLVTGLATAPLVTLSGITGGIGGGLIGNAVGNKIDEIVGTKNAGLYGGILGGLVGGLGYGYAAQKVSPELRNVSLKLYDKFAPKTNRVITKFDGTQYRQLTPTSKYWRDLLFFGDDYNTARAMGQYPETFAERRAYLTDLNDNFTRARGRLIERRTNDFVVRNPDASDLEGWYRRRLETKLPTKMGYTSVEGHVPLMPNGAVGINNARTEPITAIRKANSLLPLETKQGLRGTTAHELDHSVLALDSNFTNLWTFASPEDQLLAMNAGYKPYYFTLNKNSEMYNDYAPVTEQYRGSWFGSPNEINSEMQNALEQLSTTKSYRDLNFSEKAFVDKFMSNRFGTDINSPVWGNISKKGYFKKGGLIPKAEEGTLLNFWLKANNFLNSDVGKGLVGIASKGISAIGNSIKQTNIANEFDKETDAQVKAVKNKAYNSAYSIGLQLAPLYLQDHDDVHYSDIDYRFFADMYAKGNLNLDLIEEYKLNREKQKQELYSQGDYGKILLDGLGTLGLILGTPKKEDLTTNQLLAVVLSIKLVSSNDIKLDTRFTNPTWSAITSLTSGESELDYLNRIKPLWRI